MTYYYLTGIVGEDITLAQVAMMLQTEGEITFVINSVGGDLYEGIAIANEIARNSSRISVEISGICASVATAIACSAGNCKIYRNSTYMIHKAWTIVEGNDDVLRDTADRLTSATKALTDIYVRKTGMTEADIAELLAGDGTLMMAQDAVSFKFCDEVIDAEPMQAYAQYHATKVAEQQTTPSQEELMEDAPKAEATLAEDAPIVAPTEPVQEVTPVEKEEESKHDDLEQRITKLEEIVAGLAKAQEEPVTEEPVAEPAEETTDGAEKLKALVKLASEEPKGEPTTYAEAIKMAGGYVNACHQFAHIMSKR